MIIRLLYMLGLLLTGYMGWSLTNGTMCYDCRHAVHPRDCYQVTRCGPHEVCSVDKYTSDDGIITYDSGCKSRIFCNGFGTRANVDAVDLEDAGTYPICSSCCDTDYCNVDQCDSTVDHNIKYPSRCLLCTDQTDPRQCEAVTSCSADEWCYTQKHMNMNGDIRYNLGCRQRAACGSASIPSIIVGRNINNYCLSCCNSTNCNGQLCPDENEVTTKRTTLPAPTPVQTCTETAECQYLVDKFNICDDPASAKDICPVTCEICTQTSTPNVFCVDSPECSILVTHFADSVCDDERTRTVICPRSCRSCGVASESPTTVRASTTTTTTSTTTTPKPTTARTTTPRPTTVRTTTPQPTTPQPTTIFTSATPTGGTSHSCVDNSNCPHLVSVFNICGNAHAAKDICPDTCKKCATVNPFASLSSHPCIDAANCGVLASTDICELEANATHPTCPKMCGLCKVGSGGESHWVILPYGVSVTSHASATDGLRITEPTTTRYTSQTSTTSQHTSRHHVTSANTAMTSLSCADEDTIHCVLIKDDFHLCHDMDIVAKYGCYKSCDRCDLLSTLLPSTDSQFTNPKDTGAIATATISWIQKSHDDSTSTNSATATPAKTTQTTSTELPPTTASTTRRHHHGHQPTTAPTTRRHHHGHQPTTAPTTRRHHHGHHHIHHTPQLTSTHGYHHAHAVSFTLPHVTKCIDRSLWCRNPLAIITICIHFRSHCPKTCHVC